MRSGCSHRQDGAYPAFQHQSNVDPPTSNQNNNVSLAPVVHTASRTQINMVAPQDPEELRVDDGPAQKQQHDAQSQQNVQRHVANTGFQHPKHGDSMWTPNADINSSLPVSAKCSGANKKSTRQCVNNGGQYKENFSRYFLKESNFNNNSTLQQRHHLYCAPSVATSSVVPVGNTVGVTAQTFPLQNQHSPKPQKTRCRPMSRSLLEGSCPDAKAFLTTRSSSSEETNANIELNTSTHFSDERHCKSWHMKSSLNALNREHTRCTPLQKQVTSPSASGERKPPTDDDIQDFVKEMLDRFRERQCVSSAEQGIAALGKAPPDGSKAEFIQTRDCPTDASGKHSTEYPQIMMEVAATCTKIEDKSPVILISRSGLTSNELTERDPSYKSQEDYTFLGLNSNMNLDEMDQVAGDFLTSKHMIVKEEGHAGLKPVANMQGVINVSVDLQIKPSSVIAGNKTSVLTSLNEYQDTIPRKRKTTETPHCHTTDPEVMAHSKVTASVDQIQVHDVRTISTDQSEWLWNLAKFEGVMENAGSVHLQTDLSSELCGKSSKVQELSIHPEDKGKGHSKVLKDPKYEDVSDYEDVSKVLRKLPNREDEKCSFPPCSEVPLYEDISDNENLQMGGLAVEKHSPCEGLAQVRTENISPKRGALDKAKQCSCPCYVETDDGFEYQLCPRCDEERQLEGQTNHSVLSSPSSELKDGDEDGDQMDDWIVIPMSVSDLTFEPEDEEQDVPENIVPNDVESGNKGRPTHCESHCPSPKPVAASASYQIEVFQTIDSFLLAKAVQFGNRFEVASSRRASYSEPEDSSDTEDSCDYPSPSGLTYLSQKRSASLPPVTDDSGSEEESEHDDAKNVQKVQSSNLVKSACIPKLRELMAAKAGSKQVQPKANRKTISKKQDLIDSKTEDENDQNCRRKATRKRIFSDSVDYGNATWGQPQGHTLEMSDSRHGTVKETADSPAPHHSFKELPRNTGTSGKQIENKVDPEHVQHETERKNIPQKIVINLNSDTEDSDQNHKKEEKRRLILSGLGSCIQQKLIESGSEHVQHKTNRQMTSKRGFHHSDKVVKEHHQISKNERKPSSVSKDGVSSLFASQNRQSAETLKILCGSAKEKPGKTIPSSEEFQVKHPQSVGEEADTNSAPTPVIQRLFVSNSTPPSNNVRLSKESRVNRQSRHETLAPKTPTATCNKTHSLEKNTHNLNASNKVQAKAKKLFSRQLSLPNEEGPSTSRSASRRLSGETTSVRLPKTKKDMSSSNLMRSLRSKNYEPRREARPLPSHPDRAPIQRHNSHESATPLMKRTRFEAMQLTKATNRVTQKEQRSYVGEGYKWSEKPQVTRAAKGSTSERRKYRTPRSYQ